ncbi:MAG: NAD(P)-dependent alcohol dehydrogenase [Solirubrobacteraceae bacterium]
MPTAIAAVLAAHHEPFLLREVEIEHPRPGEVLIRTVATGLCHTDLSAREGLIPFPLPGVLGHEGAGIIEEVGEGVSDLVVGDHVVMSFTFCGRCRPCRTGHPVYCETWAALNLFGGARADGTPTLHQHGAALHGHFFGQSSFATRALASAGSVIKVPTEAPLELLGPLACGVQTGAQAVLNVLQPEPGTTLAVFGAGGVGLSAVIAATHLTGATVAVVDVNAARLELATKLGASHAIDPREHDPVKALREITGGRGIDRTLEATGIPAVLRQAIDVLAPLGKCGIVGAPAADAEVSTNILGAIVTGSSVIGINQGDPVPRNSIPALVELHRQGRFPFDELVQVYPFEEIEQAATDAAAGTVIKPVLRMPHAAL